MKQLSPRSQIPAVNDPPEQQRHNMKRTKKLKPTKSEAPLRHDTAFVAGGLVRPRDLNTEQRDWVELNL